MKEEIRLSVGIPTYNQGEYLGECIQSLLDQTVQPLEIVVSNNHCTDCTDEVLEKFRGRIRVIRPPSHIPMFPNFNYLVSQLSGEWFSVLCSDDVAKKDFVKILTQGINASSKAVLVHAPYELIDKQGKSLGVKRFKKVRRITSPPDTFNQELPNSKVCLPASAVRKDTWRKVGGFPEQCGICADWGFTVLISPEGDFIYQPETVMSYRYQYRPELDRARHMEWLQNDSVIYTQIVPKVMKKLADVNARKVRRMGQKRLHGALSLLSRMLGPEEKQEVVRAVNEWAEEYGCEVELARFAAGDILPRRTGLYLVVKVLRNLLRF